LERERLGEHFRLCQPPFEAMRAVLNKAELFAACQRSGLDAPETWDVSTAGTLPAGRYPVIVKRRMKVGTSTNSKGIVVRGPSELGAALERDRRGLRCHPMVIQHEREALEPIVQEFVPGEGGVYNLTGFVDREGGLRGIRASRKVHQRPVDAGLGICFEAAEIDTALAGSLTRLCKEVGFFGIFEAEFLQAGGRSLLIDFNPRFYGEIAFECARGLHLPRMAYADAVGDGEWLAGLEAEAAAARRRRLVYCERVSLELDLWRARRRRTLRPADERYWRAWLGNHEGRVVQPFLSRGDPLPGVLRVAQKAPAFVSVTFGLRRRSRRRPRASMSHDAG
jgi:predicted ATP-grasp superfamily ATP-dependent carboligase